MPDQNPDVLKSQAEAALRRLEEARLHERCPKACKSCSQKHRKCQFKTGQYPKCDLCAKNNRECEIIPTPVTHIRRTVDSTHSTQTQQADPYGYSSSSVVESLNRPHRSYATASPTTTSPVDARSMSGISMKSYPRPQDTSYQYGPTASGQLHHSEAYVGSQTQYGQYGDGQYGGSQGHSPEWGQHQGRSPNQYYLPAQGHIQSSTAAFTPSATDWPESRGHASGIGQDYGYTSSPSPVRQSSAPNVPQIHTSTSYHRATGYHLSSPTSPGSTYAMGGNPMYQMPAHNTSSVRYGTGSTGQGYSSGLSNPSAGPASESMYYQQ